MRIDEEWKEAVWRQFGAAIDMLENAMLACPEDVWRAGPPHRAFWYLAYHTLFFLDLYTFGSVEGFAPPAPFTLGELDPAGVYPARAYSQEELGAYLTECRDRCRSAIASLTEETAGRRCAFGWGETSYGELVLRNMRHVQHHAAQLNWVLREATDAAPGWVGKARTPLGHV